MFKHLEGILLKLSPDPRFVFQVRRLRGATILEKFGMNF